MKNTVFIIILISIFFITCDNSNTTHSNKEDTDAVKKCFKEFKHHVLQQDGDSSILYVANETINYYGVILKKAISIDSASLQKLDAANKILILTTRQQYTKEALNSMTAEQYYILLTNSGVLINKTIENTDIGAITIEAETALGQIIVSGTKSPFKFEFIKENKDWKINLISLFPLSEVVTKQMSKTMGMTEEQFINFTVQMNTKITVTNKHWHPMKGE